MKNGMRVIDCEHHYGFQMMIDEWKKTMTPEKWSIFNGDHFDNPSEMAKKLFAERMEIGEKRIKILDECGIDFAQVSLTTPGAEHFEPEMGKKIAKIYNDTLMEAIKKYPDRLGAYMALCPEDVEWSLKEIDRCAKGGMFGWSTLSNFNGKYLDEPKYFPILEKLASYNMPIYLHPTYCYWKEIVEFGCYLNGPTLGFTIDTQLLYMRLIHRGVFDKLPNLKVIMGHDCEGMGFFRDRIDTAFRQGFVKFASSVDVSLQHKPSYYLDNNTLATTSGNYSMVALHATIDAMGKDKIMLGTDFNYEDSKRMVDFIGDNPKLSQEEKEAILYKNAEALGFGKKY